MARPTKERVICASPKILLFAPTHIESDDKIILTLDEYEVIRLHDLEHLTQSEVASQMLISRPTVTALLNSAHTKIADALTNGKALKIHGGNCRICEIGSQCPREKSEGDCHKRHRCSAACRLECKSGKS